MNRREFMGTSIAGGILAPNLRSEAAEITNTGEGGWYSRPMRWAQLAFVEDDPGHYDPDFWLEYFRRVHADAVRAV